MAKILLVEDDLYLASMLKTYFKKASYTVDTTVSGEEALTRLKLESYDILVIDWGLPDLEGVEVCRKYRANGGIIPILMLTGKDQSIEKVVGLDSGADDYLTKPFENMELLARIRALLRRQPLIMADGLCFGNLILDTTSGELKIDQLVLKLPPRETAILEVFLKSPNQTISPDELISRAWSDESEVVADSVRPYITKIRAKLKQAGANATINLNKGFGYVLELKR